MTLLSRVLFGEANSSSSIQESARNFGIQNVSYRIRNSLQLFAFLSHIKYIRVIPACFLNNEFSIVMPSTRGLPSSFFLSVFPTKTVYTFLFFHIRGTCPANFMYIDWITLQICEI